MEHGVGLVLFPVRCAVEPSLSTRLQHLLGSILLYFSVSILKDIRTCIIPHNSRSPPV